MNRNLQTEEILDYDPQIESYLAKHAKGGDSGRGAGRLVFALMLLAGVIVAWLYGGLGRFLDLAFWKSGLLILGHVVPIWIVASGVFFLLLLGLAARRRGRTVDINR